MDTKIFIYAVFPVPYHFSISLTCGFACRHGTCFLVVHARHLALKRVKYIYQEVQPLLDRESTIWSKFFN